MITRQLAELLGVNPTTTTAPDTRSWPERLQEQIQKDGAAVYQPAWTEFQRSQADFQQRMDREMRDAGQAERGRALVVSGATAGLPADLVDRARSAVAAERAAAAVLDQLGAEADQYIARHGLVPPASSTYKTLHIAEAVTAANDTATAAVTVCARLGLVAEKVEHARGVLASVPAQRRAIEQQYQAQLEQIDQAAATARRVLRDLGV